ncbi:MULTISPECIES: HAD-IIA family hydrolase [Limnochorda]|uniref:HAD-IIA family hydrolase n=1 Tax=Limnochorda TaxID=1676651 RepID=UPI001D4B7F4F|nr:HAD-IIA family hydrolase [Limnochorda pilosa]MBO2486615.1 HAD family hydrolase [Bacillota bacterium]MBO2518514.1 HAD family hydrolase [Bacillota bacterium]
MTYRGFIFDLDGTIYRGERLIPGADRAVAELRRRGLRVVFVTNKPLSSRAEYAAKLTRLGIPTPVEDVISSSFVMARYLHEQEPGTRVYCIGEAPLIEELRQMGIQVVDDPRQARFLVVGFDRTFDYQKLTGAMLAIRAGARFVATNPDRTCPVEDGEIPDCAGMVGAVTGVTGAVPEAVVGKPSPYMVAAALDRLGCPPSQVGIAGDRLETDIAMGAAAGMRTFFVLTGGDRLEQLADDRLPKPDHVVQSVAEIPDLLD